jgi:hypothetical protein
MNIDTNSKHCSFELGNRHFSFLVYKIIEIRKREYGSFDIAIQRYFEILDVLLSINQNLSLEFIQSIDDDERFEIISQSFVAMTKIFKSADFITSVELISEKFKTSNYYKRIAENIAEAKNALDDTENLY